MAKWGTGLFGCFSDWGSCCYGVWCTPCLYGDTVAKHNNDDACCGPCCGYFCLAQCGLCAFMAGPNRKSIRGKHNLADEPCSDCCVHCWCSPCAVCQEAREVKAQDNKAQVTGTAMMQPPGAQAMTVTTRL